MGKRGTWIDGPKKNENDYNRQGLTTKERHRHRYMYKDMPKIEAENRGLQNRKNVEEREKKSDYSCQHQQNQQLT